MRDEAEHAMESMGKIFPSGRELGVPVPASHHKLPRATNCRKSALILPRIKAAIQCRCVAGLLSLQCWFTMLHSALEKLALKYGLLSVRRPPIMPDATPLGYGMDDGRPDRGYAC
jgi:hypothetical protein